MTAATLPGRAGQRLALLGDRAVVSDLYDEVGSHVYHQLASGDNTEVRELLRMVRPRRGPVLDLAAGSGRLTLPLLALGREVVALELSPSMIGLLREQLATVPPTVRDRCTVVEADMSGFRLDRRFDAVVLGTSSVSLLDAGSRQGLYRCVRAHLAPDGVFLLSTVDLDTAGAAGNDEFELPVETGDGTRYLVYEHWPAGSESRVVAIFPAEVQADGSAVPVCTTTIRVLPASQLRDELAGAGFRVRRTVPVVSRLRRRYDDVLLEVEVAS